MKLRSLTTLLLLFFTAGVHAQTSVDVFINGIKSGQYIIKNDQATGGISYKKSVYRNMERLSIQVKGKTFDGPYIRTVEIMGDGEAPLFTAAETVGVNGQFILTDKAVLKRLLRGKPIRLMLIKAPSNTKSMEAVRKIYIGTFSRG